MTAGGGDHSGCPSHLSLKKRKKRIQIYLNLKTTQVGPLLCAKESEAVDIK